MHPDELKEKAEKLITHEGDQFVLKLLRQQAMNNILSILNLKGINSLHDKAVYTYLLDKIEIIYENNPNIYEPVVLRKGMRYIDFKTLVPLAHPTLNNFYRVPIKITKTQYRVYIDKGCVRIFTQATVPPYLLSKITMAKAASDDVVKDNDLYEYDLFVTKDKNGMSDVAWRASESMYTIVLHKNELKELLGEHL